MGINHNAANEADLLGYEMKKDTRSKTTFGDWSPDIALWKRRKPYADIALLDRDTEFLVYFGKSNPNKNGRYSWSGEPCPKISQVNSFGQKLDFDDQGNIVAMYCYSSDRRPDKAEIMPEQLQAESLVVAKWLRESMQSKLNRKFNDKGWFKCFKDSSGLYTKIGFGDPINYEDWVKLVKDGIVFFDSGMYQGNNRPYSQWRANNDYWNSLITETY